MGEAAKKILQDQSCLEKSAAPKPFSFMAPNKLFGGAGSSFQVRENPLGKDLSDAEGSTKLELDLKLATSNTYSTQGTNNHYNNHTFDNAEKDLINDSFSTPSVGVNNNTNQTCEGQTSEPGLDHKLATEMEADPKRLKIMANRIYSKKYRLKKMFYIDHLEKLTDAIGLKTANIRLQIQENKNMQQSLLIEQHQLKLKIATREKDRVVKEVEIGNNMAEVNRLRELQINQLQGKEHPMRNKDAGLHAFNAHLDLDL
ncbi:hypothetical protein VNO77_43347 [Canavalia gladiata]|uniref:Uncharacterized protein n=1 Tax=Canavalia gladiata TaxID=3824 RepID=A0AAN9JW35_CANGL